MEKNKNTFEIITVIRKKGDRGEIIFGEVESKTILVDNERYNEICKMNIIQISELIIKILGDNK